MIGWVSFFDVGLGNDLKNKLAESNALYEKESSRIYVSTTYAILIVISIFLFLTYYAIHYFINWNEVLNTIEIASSELSVISLMIFRLLCLQFVLQTINTILTAFHKVVWVSVINLISQIGSLIVILILLKNTENSLLILVLILAGIPILFN